MSLLSNRTITDPPPLTRSHQPVRWFAFLLVSLIMAGICFRLSHIDQRVFWDDEVTTALRISGYTLAEATKRLYTGQIIAYADLAPYLSPNPDKTIQDVLQGLAAEDPHMPLLYFMLLRYWSEWFGSSVYAMRSLSVVFSILSLPAMYWLCRELFQARRVALVATALVAISPFHILYAQEARSYSCWILVTLLSSGMLLRSLRYSTRLNWMGYAILSVMGIFSHLFYVGVALGHGVYLLLVHGLKLTERVDFAGASRPQNQLLKHCLVQRLKLTQQVRYYLLAMLLMLASYFPWMQILWKNRQQSASVMTSAWANQHYSLPSLMSMWFGNISRLFFDVGLGSHDGLKTILPTIPVIIVLVSLVFYALYFVWQQSPIQVSGFILTLIFTSASCLFASDMIFGGRISGLPRYSIAMFLGYQLAIAYLFTLKLGQGWRRMRWITAFAVIIVSCLGSYAVTYPALVWWHQGPQNTRYIPAVIAQVNQAENPLVVTEQGISRVPAFGSKLKPEARIQLLRKGKLSAIPAHYKTIFFFRPTSQLKQAIAQSGKISPIPQTGEMLYRFNPYLEN